MYKIKCYYCGEELNYLSYRFNATCNGVMYSNGSTDTDVVREIEGSSEFFCPLCKEKIASSRKEAEMFFNGEINGYNELEFVFNEEKDEFNAYRRIGACVYRYNYKNGSQSLSCLTFLPNDDKEPYKTESLGVYPVIYEHYKEIANNHVKLILFDALNKNS